MDRYTKHDARPPRFDVEPLQCTCCEACVEAFPAFFGIDEAEAYVVKQPRAEAEIAICRNAIEICPMSAISETTRYPDA